MTRASVARGVVRLALTSVILTWVTASASHPWLGDLTSTPASTARLESVPDVLLFAPAEPVRMLATKLNDGRRGMWAVPTTYPVIDSSVQLLDVLSSSPTPSTARVAQGVSGRGPPFPSDP